MEISERKRYQCWRATCFNCSSPVSKRGSHFVKRRQNHKLFTSDWHCPIFQITVKESENFRSLWLGLVQLSPELSLKGLISTWFIFDFLVHHFWLCTFCTVAGKCLAGAKQSRQSLKAFYCISIIFDDWTWSWKTVEAWKSMLCFH